MSRWAASRKARFQKPPRLDPVEDLTVRVAHRICAMVYGGVCDCAQRNLGRSCDAMTKAAQAAFAEIRGE